MSKMLKHGEAIQLGLLLLYTIRGRNPSEISAGTKLHPSQKTFLRKDGRNILEASACLSSNKNRQHCPLRASAKIHRQN